MQGAFALLFVTVCCCIRGTCETLQSASVKGTLFCGDKPAANVKVKLVEDVSDDLMDEGLTDSNGYFELSGSESEMTNTDPVLKIYHDCDDGYARRWIIKIPQQYVTAKAAKITKVFDVGKMNLESRLYEDQNCF